MPIQICHTIIVLSPLVCHFVTMYDHIVMSYYYCTMLSHWNFILLLYHNILIMLYFTMLDYHIVTLYYCYAVLYQTLMSLLLQCITIYWMSYFILSPHHYTALESWNVILKYELLYCNWYYHGIIILYIMLSIYMTIVLYYLKVILYLQKLLYTVAPCYTGTPYLLHCNICCKVC